jgi:hypothetical protein
MDKTVKFNIKEADKYALIDLLMTEITQLLRNQYYLAKSIFTPLLVFSSHQQHQ